MKNELKPCPFCGAKAKLQDSSGTDYNGDRISLFRVFCTGCGVFSPYKGSREDAVVFWNDRPTEENNLNEESRYHF